jgi:DnaJ-domain-containing protein 1
MIIKISLALLGLTYALSPYDLLPDFLVGLGWIDDIVVLILLWKFLQYYNRRHNRHESDFQNNGQAYYRGAKDDRFSENGTSGTGRQSGEKVKQNDPYKVLGVDKNASLDEIKHAYKGLASKYHPDKVTHLGEEFRVLAEQRFKEIQEAYQKLIVK